MLLALALFLPSLLHASPQSEELTRKGLDDLNAGRYVRAIESFNAAVKADAKDLRPVFFQAVALNRLASHREAYLLLRGVEAQGFSHPEMDFEAGWSLMGMKRAKACIDRLERFEKSTPGRGQTAEFTGRCYLMLGALDKAEASFRQAVERDRRLKPTVDLSLVALEQARGNTAAARERLEAAAMADAPTGRALREVLGLPSLPGPVSKPFNVGLAVTVGHNDNVIGLGNTIPLPSDISRKGANFTRLNFNPEYTFRLGPADSLTAGYAMLADTYDGLSAANIVDHFFYGDYRHSFGPTVLAALRVSDEETSLGGSDFRSQQVVRPALGIKLSANTLTEFAVQRAHSRYKFDVPATFNRSGNANSIEINHGFQPAGSELRGRVGYAYTRNRSGGADFDFSANAITVALAYPLVYQVTGQIAYSYSRARFDNPNSLSPSGSARSDDTHAFSVQLVRPITRTFSVFLQYTGTRVHSNIALYSFDQNVAGIGIAARF